MEATIPVDRRLSAVRRFAFFSFFGILGITALLWISENQVLYNALNQLHWFEIHDIKVECEWPLTQAAIEKALPPLKGKSLLTLKVPQLVSQLQQRPWVGAVTVKKEFPDTLRLQLAAKKAVAIQISKGKTFFIGAQGERIEKTSPDLLRALDLPVLAFERENDSLLWDLPQFLSAFSRLQTLLDPGYSISQATLGKFPYFKIFLSRPRLEVLFSYENWETQVPMLLLLLHHPPRQIQNSRRLNLVFPKKAVVSTPQTQ